MPPISLLLICKRQTKTKVIRLLIHSSHTSPWKYSYCRNDNLSAAPLLAVHVGILLSGRCYAPEQIWTSQKDVCQPEYNMYPWVRYCIQLDRSEILCKPRLKRWPTSPFKNRRFPQYAFGSSGSLADWSKFISTKHARLLCKYITIVQWYKNTRKFLLKIGLY